MSYLKDFIDGFIDGWINLLNLNPIEEEPTLTWLESKSVEEALSGDISAIAGDFKNAMEKADLMTEENLMLIHTATIRYRHKNEYYDRYTVFTQKQKVNGFVWISTNDDSRKVVNCEKMLNYLESLYIEKKND